MLHVFRQGLFLSGIAAMAVLLAACSGESGDAGGSGGAAEIAACPLLDPAEIEPVVGEAMRAGEERAPVGGGENAGRMTACSWIAASDAPGATIVTLQVWSWPPGSGGGANYLESFRKAAEEYSDLAEPQPVSLGDEALWDGTAVDVRSGDVSLSISVTGKEIDPAKSKSEAAALAGIVLRKL